jgi:hypothetical protein
MQQLAGLFWNNFKAKWEELSKQNLRLVDIEIYREGGATKYAGVWRAGSDAHFLWSGVDFGSFKSKWEELSKQNLRLVDLEIYQEGATKFTGVWRAGSDAHYLWVGADWESFAGKWYESRSKTFASPSSRCMRVRARTAAATRSC